MARSSLRHGALRHYAATVALAAALGAGGRSFGTTQPILQNYAGGSLNDVGAINGYYLTPPDVNGAAGPGNVLEFVNGLVGSYDKSTGALQSLSGGSSGFETNAQFWENAGLPASIITANGGPFDPRVQYDAASGHWFASELTFGTGASGQSPNDLLLGVSNSSDPTQGWGATYFAATPAGGPSNDFLDFDTLGVNGNSVTLGGNLFTGSNSSSFSLFNIPKSSLLATNANGGVAPTTAGMVRLDNQSSNTYGITPQPVVVTYPGTTTNTTEQVITVDGNNAFVQNTLAPTGSSGQALVPHFEVAGETGQTTPPAADQPSGIALDSGDARVGSRAPQVGNLIYAVQTVGNPGDTLPMIHWSVINAATSSVVSQGNLADPTGKFGYFYPSIAANANGDVVIGFSHLGGPGTDSGTDPNAGNASAYAVIGHTSGGTLSFGTPFALKEGTANNYSLLDGTVNRWGDYTSTVIDPSNPDHFWTLQEYAAGSATWGTQISEINATPLATLVNWNLGVNGNYSNALNWTPPVVPNDNDGTGAVYDAVISAGPVTVTMDISPRVDQLTLGNSSTLNLDGDTLTVDNVEGNTNGGFIWSSGTIDNSAATAGVATFAGGTWTSASTLNIGDGVHPVQLSNTAVLDWNGTNTGAAIAMHGDTTFTNTAAGTVDLQSDQAWNTTAAVGADNIINAGLWEKTGGTGTSTIEPDFQNTGNVTVASGTMAFTGPVANGGGVITVNASAGLTAAAGISGGGALQVVGTATVSSFAVNSLEILGTGNVAVSPAAVDDAVNNSTSNLAINNGGASLNLNNTQLTIHYGTGADPDSSVRGLLVAGYNGGQWNGPGINSATAAAAASGTYALGYADGADQVVAGLAAGNELVKFTLAGDANLDGKVDFNDFLILQSHFGMTGAKWDQGDFNYDGTVNFNDFLLLQLNFGKSLPGVAAPVVTSAQLADMEAFVQSISDPVPEPATLGLLAVGAVGLLRRRRHRPRQAA